jgi:hypothetical protein
LADAPLWIDFSVTTAVKQNETSAEAEKLRATEAIKCFSDHKKLWRHEARSRHHVAATWQPARAGRLQPSRAAKGTCVVLPLAENGGPVR